jgi:hypothetical protein
MLTIEIVKRADGGPLLRCTRRDGSTTWQRQDGRQANFFPFHDLTHFAVETTLGFRTGFFGLIADGWEIAGTGGKGARGRLPAEAIVVEYVVGLFESENVGGAGSLSAEAFNAQLAALAADGRIASARPFADAQLDAVREARGALHARWAALPPGAGLELHFDLDSGIRGSPPRRRALPALRFDGACWAPRYAGSLLPADPKDSGELTSTPPSPFGFALWNGRQWDQATTLRVAGES